MKTLFTLVFLLLVNSSFAQGLQALEEQMKTFERGEKFDQKKEIAYRILEIDGLNSIAVNYLLAVYARPKQPDSLRAFFATLINNNPQSADPYLIRARESNILAEGLTNQQVIDFLKKGKAIFPAHPELTYQLGARYYKKFIDGFVNNVGKAELTADANNATTYFTELANLDPTRKEELKYPLIQLAEYLGNRAISRWYSDWHNPAAYFPVSAFLRLPENWETTYSVNVLSRTRDRSLEGVESALFSIKWYSKHLAAMLEPVLRSNTPDAAYRITYLRTFDRPIVMRIENKQGKITLYWKVTDGMGGYEPGNIIQNGSKELTMAEWQKIEDMAQNTDFWHIPSTQTMVASDGSIVLEFDGSRWIMEGKNSEKYHVVDRWGEAVRQIFNSLLPLTDIQLTKQDMH